MFVYEQSFRGKRHLQKGLPCQDQCGHCITPNGWIVAIAADGVSASPLSEVGAAIAVSSCIEYFSEFKYSPVLDAEGIQLVLRDAFNYALRRIKESANPDGFIPFSKMTTLQVVIYHEKIGLHWGQAGDGALIIRNAKGSWKRITFAMKNKEDNESPITLQDGADAWKFGSLQVQDLDSILLTTDGVADIVGDGFDDKEISNTVVNYLMTPPVNTLNKQAADSYYQHLFFENNEEETKADDTSSAATARLSSITDDITVLLIGGLLSSENASPESQSTIVSRPNSVPVDSTNSGLDSEENGYQEHIASPDQLNHNLPDPICNNGSSFEPTQPDGEKTILRRIPSNGCYSDTSKNDTPFDGILNILLANKLRLLIIILVLFAACVLICNMLFNKLSVKENSNADKTILETEVMEVILSSKETGGSASDGLTIESDIPVTAVSSEIE